MRKAISVFLALAFLSTGPTVSARTGTAHALAPRSAFEQGEGSVEPKVLSAAAAKAVLRWPANLRARLETHLLARRELLGLSKEAVARLMQGLGLTEHLSDEQKIPKEARRTWLRRSARPHSTVAREIAVFLSEWTGKAITAEKIYALADFRQEAMALMAAEPAPVRRLEEYLRRVLGKKTFSRMRKEFEDNYGPTESDTHFVQVMIVQDFQERWMHGGNVRFLSPPKRISEAWARGEISDQGEVLEWQESMGRYFFDRGLRVLPYAEEDILFENQLGYLYPAIGFLAYDSALREEYVHGRGIRFSGGPWELQTDLVDVHLAVLRDTSLPTEDREGAISILGRLADPRAVQPLLDRFDLEEDGLKGSLLHALGRIADPKAIPVAIRALEDSPDVLGYTAAQALSKIGEPSVQPLLKLWDRSEGREEIRGHVLQVFQGLGDTRAAKRIVDQLWTRPSFSDAQRESEALDAIRGPAVDYLIPGLRDPDERIRLLAVHALSGLRDPAAEQALLTYLANTRTAEKRDEALKALAASGGRRAGKILLRLARSKDARIRMFAAAGLEHVGGREVVEVLNKMAEDRDVFVRINAVSSLVRVGEPLGIEGILKALGDRDVVVVNMALQGTSMADDERVLPAVMKLFDSPYPQHHLDAAKALYGMRHEHDVMPLLHDALEKETHPKVVDEIQSLLARLLLDSAGTRTMFRVPVPLSQRIKRHLLGRRKVLGAAAEKIEKLETEQDYLQAIEERPAGFARLREKAGHLWHAWRGTQPNTLFQEIESAVLGALGRRLNGQQVRDVLRFRAGLRDILKKNPGVLHAAANALEKVVAQAPQDDVTHAGWQHLLAGMAKREGDTQGVTQELTLDYFTHWYCLNTELEHLTLEIPSARAREFLKTRTLAIPPEISHVLWQHTASLHEAMRELAGDSYAERPLSPEGQRALARLELEASRSEAELSGLIHIVSAPARQLPTLEKLDAIKRLGELGDSRAVKPLISLFRDEQFLWGSFRAAQTALEKIGKAAVEPLMREMEGDAGTGLLAHAPHILGKSGDARVVPVLARLLRSRAPAKEPGRRAAVAALVRMNIPAADNALLDALGEAEEITQGHILHALHRVADQRVLGLLLEAMDSAEVPVREGASYSLARLAAPESHDAMLRALRDTVPAMRANAATALGGIGDGGAVPALTAALAAETSRETQLALITALGKLGDSRAVERIVPYLADPFDQMSIAAATALLSIGGGAVLQAMGEALDSRDQAMRLGAARVLARMRHPGRKPLLTRALKDKDNDVLLTAIEALGVFDDLDLLEALSPLQKGPPKIARAADEALGSILLNAARGMAPKAHHLPLYVRVGILEALRKRREYVQLSEQQLRTLWEMMSGPGLAQYRHARITPEGKLRKGRPSRKKKDKDRSIHLVTLPSENVLDNVAFGLTTLLAPVIMPDQVREVLAFHENIHRMLAENPEIVPKVTRALKRKLKAKGFRLLKESFQNNYTPYDTVEEFVEELIVTFYQEDYLFGNPVRLILEEDMPLPPGMGDSPGTYAQKIKAGQSRVHPDIYQVIRRHTGGLRAEIRDLLLGRPGWETGRPLPPLGMRHLETRSTRDISLHYGPGALEELMEVLGDKRYRFADRVAAAKRLLAMRDVSKTKRTKVMEAVLHAYAQDKSFVRHLSLPLAETGDLRVVEYLVFALRRDMFHAHAAIEALGKMARGDAKALTSLAGFFEHPNHNVRENIAMALSESGPEGLARLAAILQDQDQTVDSRRRAAGALSGAESWSASIRAVLVQALRQDDAPMVRREVAEALGRHGGVAAAEALLEALTKDASAGVRARAAKALGRIGAVEAMEHMNDAAIAERDAAVREAIHEALGGLLLWLAREKRQPSEPATHPVESSLLAPESIFQTEGKGAEGIDKDFSRHFPEHILRRIGEDLPDKEKRKAVFRIHGQLHALAAADPMAFLTTDLHGHAKTAEERETAIVALGKIGTREATEHILRAARLLEGNLLAPQSVFEEDSAASDAPVRAKTTDRDATDGLDAARILGTLEARVMPEAGAISREELRAMAAFKRDVVALLRRHPAMVRDILQELQAVLSWQSWQRLQKGFERNHQVYPDEEAFAEALIVQYFLGKYLLDSPVALLSEEQESYVLDGPWMMLKAGPVLEKGTMSVAGEIRAMAYRRELRARFLAGLGMEPTPRHPEDPVAYWIEHISFSLSDAPRRHEAAQALAALGDPRGIRHVAEALRKSDIPHFTAFRDALISFGAPAIPQIRDLYEGYMGGHADKTTMRRYLLPALASMPTPDAIALLIDALQDSSPQVRREAARTLKKIGPKVLGPLLKQFETLLWHGRYEAISVFGALGKDEPRVVLALIREIGHATVSRRREVITALAKIGTPAVVPGLIHALDDEEWDVRMDAAEALGDVGDSRAVEALLARLYLPDGNPWMAAVRNLGRLGDPAATEPLLDAMDKAADNSVLAWILEALGEVADQDLLPMLNAYVGKKEKVLSDSAAKAIARIWLRSARALGQMHHFSWELRAVAGGMLGIEIGLKDASHERIQELRTLMLSPDLLHALAARSSHDISDAEHKGLMEALAFAIAVKKDMARAKVPALLKMRQEIYSLLDRHPEALERVWARMQRVALPRVLKELRRMFENNYGATRDEKDFLRQLVVAHCQESFLFKKEVVLLEEEPSRTGTYVPHSLPGWVEKILEEELPSIHHRVRRILYASPLREDFLKPGVNVPAILEARDPVLASIHMLRHGDPNTYRHEAAAYLAAMADPRAVAPLLEELKNPDNQPPLRAHAAQALADLQATEAAEPMLDILADEGVSGGLRGTMALALAKLRDPRAVPAILRVLEPHRLRLQQENSMEAKNQHELTMLSYCIKALGFYPSQEVNDHLIAWLPYVVPHGPTYEVAQVWEAWQESILRMGERAVEPLCRHLKTDDVPVKRRLPHLLAKLGSMAAMGPLHRLAADDDPGVRAEAKQAIVALYLKNARGLRDVQEEIRTAQLLRSSLLAPPSAFEEEPAPFYLVRRLPLALRVAIWEKLKEPGYAHGLSEAEAEEFITFLTHPQPQPDDETRWAVGTARHHAVIRDALAMALRDTQRAGPMDVNALLVFRRDLDALLEDNPGIVQKVVAQLHETLGRQGAKDLKRDFEVLHTAHETMEGFARELIANWYQDKFVFDRQTRIMAPVQYQTLLAATSPSFDLFENNAHFLPDWVSMMPHWVGAAFEIQIKMLAYRKPLRRYFLRIHEQIRESPVLADNEDPAAFLIEVLQSGPPSRYWRLPAVSSLGLIGDPRGIPLFFELLTDENQEVASMARHACMHVVHPAYYDFYIHTLRQGPAEARRHAALALKDLGDARAVPALIEALKEKRGPARNTAANALGVLKDRRAVKPLSDVLRTNGEAGGVRATAALALAGIGDAGNIPLLFDAALQRTNPLQVRRAATAAVKELLIDEEEFFPRLDRLIRDPDKKVSELASQAWATVILKSTRSVPTRHRFTYRMRGQYASLLQQKRTAGKIEEKDYQILRDFLDGKEVAFRPRHAGILAGMRSAMFSGILGQDMYSEAWVSARRKIHYLLQFDAEISALLGQHPDIVEAIGQELRRGYRKDFARIQNDFENNYGKTESEEEFLTEMLVVFIREGMFFGRHVRLLPDDAMDPSLTGAQAQAREYELLNDAERAIKFGMRRISTRLRALGYHSPLRENFLLRHGVRDADFAMAADPVGLLIHQIQDTTIAGDLRQAAYRALGRIGDARAVKPMLALWRAQDPALRPVMGNALQDMGDPIVPGLLATLAEHPAAVVRSASAVALRGIRHPDATAPLIAALSDEEGIVRAAAANALGAILMRIARRSHHLPRYLRILVKAYLEEHAAVLGMTGPEIADLAALLENPGTATLLGDKKILIPEQYLRPLSVALTKVLGKGKDITPAQVAAVLRFHEELHAALRLHPGIVRETAKALRARLGDHGFRRLLQEFQNNYARYRSESEAVEELIVYYLQEDLLFGDPVRVIPQGAMDAIIKEGLHGRQLTMRLKTQRVPVNPRAEQVLRRTTHAMSITARHMVYGDPELRPMATRGRTTMAPDVRYPVSTLMARLRDPSLPAAHRRRALLNLGHFPHPGAVRAAGEFLQAKDPDMRMAAAAALGTQATPFAARLLLAAVHTEVDSRVREQIHEALGGIPARAVVEYLSGVALHRDPRTADWHAALLALGRIGDDEPVEGLLGVLENFKNAAKGPQAIAVLEALAEIGSAKAVAALVALLIHPSYRDEPVRVAAVQALGEIGGIEAAEALLHVLRGEVGAVADAAQIALSRINSAAAVQATLDALWSMQGGETDPVIKYRPVEVLSAMAHPDALTALLEIVREAENMGLRRFTIEQLALKNHRESLEPILELLDRQRYLEERERIARIATARERWRKGAGSHAEDSVAEWDALRIAAMSALIVLGGDIAEQKVLEALEDTQPELRLLAAKSLPGLIPGRRVLAAYQVMLDGHPDLEVRRTAVEGLGLLTGLRSMGNPPVDQSVAVLLKALSDDDPAIRILALEVIGNIRIRDAIAAVEKMLEDIEPDVRNQARITLGHLGVRGVLGLIRPKGRPGPRPAPVATPPVGSAL